MLYCIFRDAFWRIEDADESKWLLRALNHFRRNELDGTAQGLDLQRLRTARELVQV